MQLAHNCKLHSRSVDANFARTEGVVGRHRDLAFFLVLFGELESF